MPRSTLGSRGIQSTIPPTTPSGCRVRYDLVGFPGYFSSVRLG